MNGMGACGHLPLGGDMGCMAGPGFPAHHLDAYHIII